MPIGRRALAATSLVALVLASASAAGPPGTWGRAGKRPGSSAFEAGLARTADGVLHVLSLRRNGAKTDLWQVRFGSDGRVLGSSLIVAGWSSLANPAVVLTSDGGLRVLFGGVHSANPADPLAGLVTATAPPAGAPWALQPDPVSAQADVATADVGAGVAKDGTPIAAWATPTDLYYRYGVDPGTAERAVRLAGCCPSDPEVGVDATSGQAYVGFASSAKGASGILVAAIGPSGPAGQPVYAPGSASKGRASAVAPGQRVALTGRLGGAGVYVAYGIGFPAVKTVALWRVGEATPVLRLAAQRASEIALAPAPQGRLWLAWQRDGKLYVTRTNRAATATEPVRAITPPPRTTAIWHVQGEGSLGPLDLVVNADAAGGTTFWQQQVLPLLSLHVTAVAQAGGAVRYTFAVTDAGEPVPNATVRVGTQTLTTGIPGTVVLTTTDHPLAAFASKPGYATGSARIPQPT